MSKNKSFPQWTTRFTDNDVTGEDHLGVEGAAQGYQQYLIPGIITTTDHARYYSFYCWVLYRFIHDPDSSRLVADFKGPYFRRHEVGFILGCYSHHKDTGGITGLVGGGNNNYKARAIWESGDPVSLDADYFGHKLGGFGQYYRTAMRAMGLVRDAERPKWVYRLTRRGEELAQAFESSIRNTGYFNDLGEQGQLAFLSHDAALEYGTRACLCPQSLTDGADRDLLLHAFFRFDRKGDSNDPHVRRRLALGLILDLVSKSNGVPLYKALRPALYLKQYAVGCDYEPAPALQDCYRRWQLVQLRHTYTSALRSLWVAFLGHLRDNQDTGVTFSEFIDWATAQLPAENITILVTAYLDQLCASVGLNRCWTEEHPLFDATCKQKSTTDEYTLCQNALNSRRDPSVLIGSALRILCQLFLRFYTLHQANDPIWRELANRPRLPVTQFFDDMRYHLETPDWTVRDLLAWLYREYVLGQHEFVALEKLRHQQYDTFKFYYQDGVFTWPYRSEYKEFIRYPTLRLLNSLTMLIDLGLVVQDQDGKCSLTRDGKYYLSRVLEGAGGN